MNCPHCGQSNPPDATICAHCGNALPAPALPVTVPPSVPLSAPASAIPFQAPRNVAPLTMESGPTGTGAPGIMPPASPPAGFAPMLPTGSMPAGTYIPIGPAVAPAAAMGAYAVPCRVCGYALLAQMRLCTICGTPQGLIADPNDATVTRFIAPYGVPAPPVRDLPPEIAQMKWNWAAFGANGFWLWAQGRYGAGLAFVAAGLVPGLNLLLPFVALVLGRTGNRMAWMSRSFDSPTQFVKTQRLWLVFSLLILPFELVWLAMTTSWLWQLLTGAP